MRGGFLKVHNHCWNKGKRLLREAMESYAKDADCEMSERQVIMEKIDKGKKNLAHGIRYARHALQLLQHRSINNLSEGNPEWRTIHSTSFDVLHRDLPAFLHTYKQLYSSDRKSVLSSLDAQLREPQTTKTSFLAFLNQPGDRETKTRILIENFSILVSAQQKKQNHDHDDKDEDDVVVWFARARKKLADPKVGIVADVWNGAVFTFDPPRIIARGTPRYVAQEFHPGKSIAKKLQSATFRVQPNGIEISLFYSPNQNRWDVASRKNLRATEPLTFRNNRPQTVGEIFCALFFDHKSTCREAWNKLEAAHRNYTFHFQLLLSTARQRDLLHGVCPVNKFYVQTGNESDALVLVSAYRANAPVDWKDTTTLAKLFTWPTPPQLSVKEFIESKRWKRPLECEGILQVTGMDSNVPPVLLRGTRRSVVRRLCKKKYIFRDETFVLEKALLEYIRIDRELGGLMAVLMAMPHNTHVKVLFSATLKKFEAFIQTVQQKYDECIARCDAADPADAAARKKIFKSYPRFDTMFYYITRQRQLGRADFDVRRYCADAAFNSFYKIWKNAQKAEYHS